MSGIRTVSVLRLIAAVMVVGMIAVGCRTHRNAVVVNAPVEASWERIQVPVQLKLSSPQKLSVSGTLNMVRDSSIVISARLLGMEVAVIDVEGETMTILDKYNRQAYRVDYKKVMGGFDLTVGQLQDIITGEPMSGNLPEVPGKKKIFTVEINGVMSKLIGAYLENPLRPFCEVRYPSHLPTPYGELADTLQISVTQSQQKIEASCILNLEKAKWNGNVTPRKVTVPADYRYIDVHSPLNMLFKK